MRSSGILLHVSSLPSPYGIGTFGDAAYKFIDFLKGSGQTYWQILPLGPTSFGDSPYQSFSTFAGNPYFIDLDILIKDGLLNKNDLDGLVFSYDIDKVNYELLYKTRYLILKKAFQRFDKNNESYLNFKKSNNFWIKDYALFMSIKGANSDTPWFEWEYGLKTRDTDEIKKAAELYKDDIEFWCFLQYEFFCQWNKLKNYANENGIKIIGDIPIYVAHDSADVWSNPDLFELDKNYDPINVAGCPPDAFSPTGQLWGNPLYNWEYMKKNNYNWWCKRLKAAANLYDVVRIDHFRGFESYFSIPYGDKTAEDGKWRKGPGINFFKTIKRTINDVEIIAENLGYLTKEVEDLLENTGFPGMKILEFAFDSRESGDYLPHNYEKNSVVYIGTHDNSTALGWLNSVNYEDKKYMMEYFDFDNDQGIVWKLIRKTMATVSNICIIQMQDYLVLNDSARMNVPSTMGENWCWRATTDSFSDELRDSIFKITKLYGRQAQ